MPTHHSTPHLKHQKSQPIGILLVNLGTPEAPTRRAVRRFLRQFLSDPHVVQAPRILWWLILNLIILPVRPSRSAAAYRKIWTAQGSPLLVNSRAIADKLRERLREAVSGPLRLELAMTYGMPSIAQAIGRLRANDVKHIITLPLYPQYSSTTSAAVADCVAEETGLLQPAPKVSFISSYHDAPGYIDALAASVRNSWETSGRGDKLLMSFHGVPTSTLRNGDPYYEQCQHTAKVLAAQLGLNTDDWILSFQSRVGRETWLSPYTDATVRKFGRQGMARLDVVCPGFATDCLETLEEIEIQNGAFFRQAGGGSLHYIPALNASDKHVQFLCDLLQQHIVSAAGAEPGSAPPAKMAGIAIDDATE